MVCYLYLRLYPPNVPTISGEFIPYDHLATEDTDPFLSGGKAPVKGSRIIAVAMRHNNVRDCLKYSERKAQIPDLRLVAWYRIRSDEVADVCLFRVLSSLGTPERAMVWLWSQGLPARVRLHDERGESFTSISSANYLRKSGMMLVGGGYFARQITSNVSYTESISATWNDRGELIGASYSLNTL